MSDEAFNIEVYKTQEIVLDGGNEVIAITAAGLAGILSISIIVLIVVSILLVLRTKLKGRVFILLGLIGAAIIFVANRIFGFGVSYVHGSDVATGLYIGCAYFTAGILFSIGLIRLFWQLMSTNQHSDAR